MSGHLRMIHLLLLGLCLLAGGCANPASPLQRSQSKLLLWLTLDSETPCFVPYSTSDPTVIEHVRQSLIHDFAARGESTRIHLYLLWSHELAFYDAGCNLVVSYSVLGDDYIQKGGRRYPCKNTMGILDVARRQGKFVTLTKEEVRAIDPDMVFYLNTAPPE